MMRKAGIFGNSQGLLPPDEPSLKQLAAQFQAVIRAVLPENWQVEWRPKPPTSATQPTPDGPDAILTLCASDGTSTAFVVEVKRRMDPKLIPLVTEQIARYTRTGEAQRGLLLAPYLSPRARDLLLEADLSFADATGNLRLESDRPAVFIQTLGAQADPWTRPGDRPLRSLKGPTAGRVIRALCDFRPPYRLEELARRSGTPLGSVSRVFAFLDADALITREPRGPVTDVKWPELLRRWSDDYSFGKSNRTRTYLDPRGLSAFQEKLRQASFRYAITGSLAAGQVAPVTASRLAMAYVDEIAEAAAHLGLRPAEMAGNVVLAEAYDDVAFERTQVRSELVYAAYPQVAVDLLAGPGRGPAEAEALIDWMRENEDAWRR